MNMVILLVILSLSILFLIFNHRRKRSRIPPGPRGLPLIGNLHQLLHNHSSSLHQHLWLLSKQYGPLMSLRFGMKPILVVSSARMAKEIMKTHDLVFASRPSLLGQRKLSYNGLDIAFTPYSEYWREMKKLCVIQLFTNRQLKSFSPIREDEVKGLITKISHSASSSSAINLSEMLLRFTSSLICRIAFGKKYEEEQTVQGNERSRFHGLLNEAEAMLGEFFLSDYIPWLSWIDRVRGLESRLDKAFKGLDMFYQQVIDDHLNNQSDQQQEEDILDIFLRLMHDHDSSTPFHFTVDHIKALLMDIFIAGSDTSAVTLVWAMTSLMKNPRVMKEAQDEIRGLYEDKDFITEEDIEKLSYLKAVVKETLRLFLPNPLLLPRESIQKCEIEGYEIETKTHVLVNAWAIGRDPEAWKDPEEFYPERFFKCSRDFRGQDFELIPFGAGRRMCPGIQMGVVTVELTLANLLHSFNWELPYGIHQQDIDTEVIPGIAVHKKNALRLVPHNYTTS